MAYSRFRFFLFLSLAFCSLGARSQNKPVGYWESLLPYNTAVGVATDGTTLYTACKQAFFTFDNLNANIETYSKVEGMSDIGMESIGYDGTTSTAVLAYTDGNIDLFKNNTFYNIPDFKIKNIAGTKSIYQVYTENGVAYLATSYGVILIDLANQRDSISVQFYPSGVNQILPVTSFTSTEDHFYAVTPNGVYSIAKNDQRFVDYAYWQRMDSTDSISYVATVNGQLYLANSKKVYALVSGALQPVYVADSGVQYISAGRNHLLIGEGDYTGGKVIVMDSTFTAFDSFDCAGGTAQALELANGSIWVASPLFGLRQRVGKPGSSWAANQISDFQPAGPADGYTYDVYAKNRDVYIAHGGYDDKFGVLNNSDGISYLHNGKWLHYSNDTLLDFVGVLRDESTGILYGASFQEGLSEIYPNGNWQVVNRNSIFGPSVSYGANYHDLASLALDQSDNLWVAEMWSQVQLYVKIADSSNWCSFQVPGISRGGPMVIDDNGQIWIVSDATDGVAVYNTNGTICDPSDDHSYHLVQGVGVGNLPSNTGRCIAKDLNNNIWIGTDNGIGIVSNCVSPFTNNPPCDAEIPIVQYDQFAGYLFAGYNVTSIAVDGANRKWVGTGGNGIWLLSPDASTIVYYFTTDNSPLPSNNITKISIDQVTGDVYIGTDQGLVSFRSTATEGGTSDQNVMVFPNPVPKNYSGSIAIKGLAANSDVRITDIAGQLVYKTTAFGGQAVWNGRDYTGRKPQSGVYLVLATSSDGSQTYSGKIVFMQ